MKNRRTLRQGKSWHNTAGLGARWQRFFLGSMRGPVGVFKFKPNKKKTRVMPRSDLAGKMGFNGGTTE